MNDLAAMGLSEMYYGYFCFSKGDRERSKQHFEKSIKHSEETKWMFLSAFSWGTLGYACAMLGDPVTGKRLMEKGLKIHRDSGAEMYLSMAYCRLGEIHRHLGDLQNARSLVEEGLRLSQKNNEKHMEGWSRLVLGSILGKNVPLQIHKAEACFLKGIEILKELRMKAMYSIGYLGLGQLYLNAGEKEKAIENLKKAEGMFREMGMDYWLGKAREVLATL